MVVDEGKECCCVWSTQTTLPLPLLVHPFYHIGVVLSRFVCGVNHFIASFLVKIYGMRGQLSPLGVISIRPITAFQHPISLPPTHPITGSCSPHPRSHSPLPLPHSPLPLPLPQSTPPPARRPTPRCWCCFPFAVWEEVGGWVAHPLPDWPPRRRTLGSSLLPPLRRWAGRRRPVGL